MLFLGFVIDVILFMINHDEHFPQNINDSFLCHATSNISSNTVPKGKLRLLGLENHQGQLHPRPQESKHNFTPPNQSVDFSPYLQHHETTLLVPRRDQHRLRALCYPPYITPNADLRPQHTHLPPQVWETRPPRQLTHRCWFPRSPDPVQSYCCFISECFCEQAAEMSEESTCYWGQAVGERSCD